MTGCSKEERLQKQERAERNEAIEEELMINNRRDDHPGIYTTPGGTCSTAGHDVETKEHSPVCCTIGGPQAAPPLSSIGAKLAKIHNRAGAQKTRIIRKEESFSTSRACVVDSLASRTRIFK